MFGILVDYGIKMYDVFLDVYEFFLRPFRETLLLEYSIAIPNFSLPLEWINVFLDTPPISWLLSMFPAILTWLIIKYATR